VLDQCIITLHITIYNICIINMSIVVTVAANRTVIGPNAVLMRAHVYFIFAAGTTHTVFRLINTHTMIVLFILIASLIIKLLT